MQKAHRPCFRRVWPELRKQSRQHLLHRPTRCDGCVYNRTMRGAMSEANVKRFSGGGPPREGPMITSVSPETTSLTVPRNQPVAMMTMFDNLRNLSIQQVLNRGA
jgi:hypothetical protein